MTSTPAPQAAPPAATPAFTERALAEMRALLPIYRLGAEPGVVLEGL